MKVKHIAEPAKVTPNVIPTVYNSQAINEYTDQLHQIIRTNLDKCDLHDNENFLNTALCAIEYLNNNKTLPKDTDNIDWVFFDQIVRTEVPHGVKSAHFDDIVKFVNSHTQSNLFLQKPHRVTYKLGDNVLIEQNDISNNTVELDQEGLTKPAPTIKSLDLIKYEIERLELENRIANIRNNLDRYDNKDKKFYNDALDSKEFADAINLNSKKSDYIYKTSDAKCYYVLDGKVILLRLKPGKTLPLFKNGDTISYKQIQDLFDEFEIMSPLKKTTSQLESLNEKYQFKNDKYQEGLKKFEELTTNPHTNMLICNWCLGSNASGNQENFKLLSTTYAGFYQLFYHINTIERSYADEIPNQAFNALLLFGTDFNCKVTDNLHTSSLKRLAEFIALSVANLLRPVHDIFQYNILLIKSESIKEWKKKIQVSKSANSLGILAIKVLRSADKLDIRNISNLDDLYLALTKITYSNIPDGYQDFAQICMKYNVPGEQWNMIMKYEKRLVFAKQNKLPNIKLTSKSGITFSKLDPSDKITYILGNIIGCCMHISGNSEQCVIDGMTRENNGFYVFRNEKNEIIGAIYAWISIAGNICYDSIEVYSRYTSSIKYKAIINNLLHKATNMMLEYFPEISQINIGIGGGTHEIVSIFKYDGWRSQEIMLSGYEYGDSERQIIYAKQSELIRLHEEFPELLKSNGLVDPNRIYPKNSIQGIKNCMFFKYMYPENKYIKLFALMNVSLDKLFKIANTTEYNEMIKEYGCDDYMAIYMICGWSHIQGLLENNNKILAIKCYQYIRNIIDCLDNGYIKPGEWDYDLDSDEFDALTCRVAITCYEKGYCKFNDLKDKHSKVIKALTSEGAIACYEEGYCTINDLKDLLLDVIDALTSEGARSCYEKGYCTFNDLKDLPFNIINTLIIERIRFGSKTISGTRIT